MNPFHNVVAGAIDIAQSAALERRHANLEPLHLVWGLANHPSSRSYKIFADQKNSIRESLDKMPTLDRKTFDPSQTNPSSQLSRWLSQASARAIQQGRKEVEEADVLAFLPQYCPDLKMTQPVDDNKTEAPAFLVNLNEKAAAGKLDPVIGRTKEIRAAMEILGRRSKNNPVLVGDAGVGKTAVVEGMADLIVKGKVPDAIRDKTIYSLDLGALMAGTKYRGEFEERMQGLIKFVKEQDGQVILFIDEIHQLVGAGRTDGAMDAANLLKPALARGELHCIGATTHDEFRRYILSDSALERRFRAVPILEPSEQDSVEIMMGLKDKLEIHHGIDITDEAIFASVFLSKQYIPDKNLPDKAIDLVDEAASALKLSAEAMPAELAALEAEIRSKMIFSKTERSTPELLQEIEELKKRFSTGKEHWERDVQQLKKVSELKNRLEKLRFDLDRHQQEGQFEEASRIKYSQIPAVESELRQCQGQWKLDKSHIAQVICRQTGIPVEKILKSKQDNILQLEPYLKEKVYGQDLPLNEIAQTLVAAHAGLSDPTRPLGSFLLLGPSGVGKTETAKALAHYLFDSDEHIIRIDLSEYSEKHAVAKLIGAPAGYVGYEEGGILTEAMRRRPYSVVLFDEVEKAHPDFADILLQILDDGRLTDNKGRTVSFRNAIVIMTSNSKNVQSDFKPEVLGRLDGILEYSALDQTIMVKLVDKQLSLLNDRLEHRKLVIELDESVRKELIQRGFDPRYGARPLAAVFSKMVTRPLATALLSQDNQPGTWRGHLNGLGLVEFKKLL